MEPQAAIACDTLGFSYDGENPVLAKLDLTIEPGQFVGIIGSNGSGKSTFALLCDALLRPTSGRLESFGKDSSLDENIFPIRRRIGFVFQNPDDQLVASLAGDDVAFALENLGTDQREIRKRVREALEVVGLPGMEERETQSLSGGQKQRLALAGALALQPDMLILDEASAMLDPEGRRDLLRICHALHDQGMTVLMITQIMEEVTHCDRVIVFDRGTIRLDGTPQEVLTDDCLLEELNLEAPLALRLCRKLQNAGIPLKDCITGKQLEEELCRLHATR